MGFVIGEGHHVVVLGFEANDKDNLLFFEK